MLIYALIDPRDGQVRYIGKTMRTPHRRLKRHLARCYIEEANTHKNRWLKQLLQLGLEPVIHVLETCNSGTELSDAEIRHIAHHKKLGVRLTNATPGGDSGGHKHTTESKEKIRRALTGKIRSAEQRQRISAAHRGRKISAATREKFRLRPQCVNSRFSEPNFSVGENNGRAKLNAISVAEIRSLKGQFSQRALARIYGVSKGTIQHIHAGTVWKIREYPPHRVLELA